MARLVVFISGCDIHVILSIISSIPNTWLFEGSGVFSFCFGTQVVIQWLFRAQWLFQGFGSSFFGGTALHVFGEEMESVDRLSYRWRGLTYPAQRACAVIRNQTKVCYAVSEAVSETGQTSVIRLLLAFFMSTIGA